MSKQICFLVIGVFSVWSFSYSDIKTYNSGEVSIGYSSPNNDDWERMYPSTKKNTDKVFRFRKPENFIEAGILGAWTSKPAGNFSGSSGNFGGSFGVGHRWYGGAGYSVSTSLGLSYLGQSQFTADNIKGGYIRSTSFMVPFNLMVEKSWHKLRFGIGGGGAVGFGWNKTKKVDTQVAFINFLPSIDAKVAYDIGGRSKITARYDYFIKVAGGSDYTSVGGFPSHHVASLGIEYAL